MEILKEMPKNLEAEMAVLGTIIYENKYLYTAQEKIDTEDFYLERHKKLYEEIKEIMRKDGNFDLLVLLEHLKSKNLLQECGGVTYITDVTSASTIEWVNFDNYIKIIKNKSNSRKVIKASRKFVETAYDGNPLDSLINDYMGFLSKIFESRVSSNMVPCSHAVCSTLKEIEESYKNGGDKGISTGFKSLDRCIMGFKKGDFNLIAGRPSMGKTTLALNMAYSASKNSKAAFFSLEMPGNSLMERLISAVSCVKFKSIREKNLTDDEFEKVAKASNEISLRNLYIDDSCRTIEDIEAASRLLKFNGGLDVIFIDYLQFVQVAASRFSNNSRNGIRETVNYISGELKNLAKRLEITVVGLCQLSRAVEARFDHRPMMADLKESGNLEQDADIIMMLYKDHAYNKNASPVKAEVIVTKNRSGETGTVSLRWNGSIQRFGNLK